MTTVPAPTITTQRVQAEDGSWITLNTARSTEGSRERPIVLPGQDPSGPSGKTAKLIETGRRKVRMYRGATESLVPYAQLQIYVERGFTAEPTAEPIPTPYPCGVRKDDGSICVKQFRTPMDRIKHVQRYHEVIAPFVLNEAEKKTLMGEVGQAVADVYGSPATAVSESREVNDLKALVAQQGEQIARLVALQAQGSDVPVRPAAQPRVHRSRGRVKHTHMASGGSKTTCLACQQQSSVEE